MIQASLPKVSGSSHRGVLQTWGGGKSLCEVFRHHLLLQLMNTGHIYYELGQGQSCPDTN